MIDNVKKNLSKFGEVVATDMSNATRHCIKKADFDKTYVGWVAAKRYVDPGKTGADDDFRWCIQTDGAEYEIKPEMSNITAIGQKVRLYVPNHEYKNKYAEVIESSTHNCIHPEKVTYDNEQDIITETWLLSDMTEEIHKYKLEIKNKDSDNEEITKITFPDGSEMRLEGFIIG